MKEIKYRVVIEPDEGGMWHGYVPALRGCHTCGESVEEVKWLLQDAIKLYLECLQDEGEPLPEEPMETWRDKFEWQTVLLPEPA